MILSLVLARACSIYGMTPEQALRNLAFVARPDVHHSLKVRAVAWREHRWTDCAWACIYRHCRHCRRFFGQVASFASRIKKRSIPMIHVVKALPCAFPPIENQ